MSEATDDRILRVQCPDCPFERTSEQVENPRFSVGQHMTQRADHGYQTYQGALRRLNSEGTTDSVERPEREPPGTGGDPEYPHYRMPSKSDTDDGTVRCPGCGGIMSRPGDGVRYSGDLGGTQRVEFTTDPTDKMCARCSIVKTGDGDVITNVE